MSINKLLTVDECKKQFIKNIELVSSRHGISKAFEDYLIVEGYGLSNAAEIGFQNIGGKIDEGRLKNRIQLVKDTYKKFNEEERAAYFLCAEAFAQALTLKREDFLGPIFMDLEIGNAKVGQFFTPSYIARCMAEMTLSTVTDELQQKNYITLCDPTSGSGVMLIEACEVLRERGLNYWNYFVEGTDLDRRSYLMSYLQLSLLGIPGVFFWGDSLSMKRNEYMATPIALYHAWIPKIYGKKPDKEQLNEQPLKAQDMELQSDKKGQFILF